jgi:hypothetical protein
MVCRGVDDANQQQSDVEQDGDQGCSRCKDRIHVCLPSPQLSSTPIHPHYAPKSSIEPIVHSPSSLHFAQADPSPTYYERFKEAFVNEVNAFTDAVLDDTRKSTIIIPGS